MARASRQSAGIRMHIHSLEGSLVCYQFSKSWVSDSLSATHE